MGKRKPKEQRTTMSPYLHKTPGEKRADSQDGGGSVTLETLPELHSPPHSPASLYSEDDPAIQHETGQSAERGTSYTNADTLDNSPVTAQTLAHQLSLLKEGLSATLSKAVADAVATAIKDIHTKIRELGDRTDKLEYLTDEVIQRHTNLEDENMALREEISQLKNTCEDLENRSRRQNLRIRGVPEEISHPPPTKPSRDIVVCFHYYAQKEMVLTNARTASLLEYLNHRIQIFADLSPTTQAKRREFRPLTQLLRDNKIPYRWGYPFRLIVQHRGQSYTLHSLEKRQQLLQTLGLTSPRQSSPTKHSPLKRRISPQWHKVPGSPSPQKLALSSSASSGSPGQIT
uniref:Uncharacterized protein n=1 Tax=Xenopus tropicalis TaxID=8364 RepID=A0A1B8Y3T6_XENTR